MSIERKKMIKSLEEIFIPELRDMKFKGSFPHFRRTVDEQTNLLTFQFDRYGGGFVIELANWNETEYKTPFGEIIQLNKLSAHDLSKRQRIYPDTITEEDGKNSWFRYDKKKLFLFGCIYNKLAKKVVKRIPLMENYWNNKE